MNRGIRVEKVGQEKGRLKYHHYGLPIVRSKEYYMH